MPGYLEDCPATGIIRDFILLIFLYTLSTLLLDKLSIITKIFETLHALMKDLTHLVLKRIVLTIIKCSYDIVFLFLKHN